EVVEAVPTVRVERGEKRRETGDSVSGENTVRPAACRLAPVGDVNADEPVGLALDVLEDGLHVPEMPGVELQAEGRMRDVVDDLDRLGDGRDRRPALAADTVDRLGADPYAFRRGLVRGRPEPVDPTRAGRR